MGITICEDNLNFYKYNVGGEYRELLFPNNYLFPSNTLFPVGPTTYSYINYPNNILFPTNDLFPNNEEA